MGTKESSRQPPAYFTRFNLSQRIEHFLIMVFFTMLVITGLPQKFHDASWAQWLIVNLGGIGPTRFIHRLFGVLFVASSVYHLGTLAWYIVLKRRALTMLPSLWDVRDAIGGLKYYLGFSQEHPRFGRFDYRQKFEYWGLIFGGMIMILTGTILVWPTWATRLLPGEIVPAAKVAHSNEAFLAFLIILIWHLYGAHLAPGKFPFDSTMFTGKIARERLMKEHYLEYQRLTEGEAGSPGEVAAGPATPADPSGEATGQGAKDREASG